MIEQPRCPQCEKLASVSDDSNKIGEFLGWLFGEKGLTLCEYKEKKPFDNYIPALDYLGERGINELLAEYYGIDLEEVERERRALLEWLREVQR